MSRQAVVADPEGPCPARTTSYQRDPITMDWITLPHGWGDGEICSTCGQVQPKHDLTCAEGAEPAPCRYCGGARS